jgi:hypothetical protein
LLAALDNTVVASVFGRVNSSKQSTAGIWTYPARLLGKAKPTVPFLGHEKVVGIQSFSEDGMNDSIALTEFIAGMEWKGEIPGAWVRRVRMTPSKLLSACFEGNI